MPEVLSRPWPQARVPMNPSLPPQGVTRLLLTRIPFFKEIIVSSFSCPSCSWSNTEIQAAGRIQEQGVRYTLAVSSRQVGTALPCPAEAQHLHIPAGMGLGSPLLTTIEGIIDRVEKNPFSLGDSSTASRTGKLQEFIGKLQDIIEGKAQAHFIMDDPAGNSYLQNVYAPEEDPELSVQRYERTFEQNEELGLNDMRTEGYEAEPASGR
uniref:Zinc finger ZPR1-type domain-containing protein n=1 Tax=Zonotrichia albicollis TaxID=44394 RepID=A0A8D2MYA6_ZONAL